MISYIREENKWPVHSWGGNGGIIWKSLLTTQFRNAAFKNTALMDMA